MCSLLSLSFFGSCVIDVYWLVHGGVGLFCFCGLNVNFAGQRLVSTRDRFRQIAWKDRFSGRCFRALYSTRVRGSTSRHTLAIGLRGTYHFSRFCVVWNFRGGPPWFRLTATGLPVLCRGLCVYRMFFGGRVCVVWVI